MWNNLRRLRGVILDSRAATAVEYGLILSLIVIAILAALSNFADSLNNLWGYVDTKVAVPPAP